MAKHRKLIDKLLGRSPPANIKWDDLKGCLEHLGYEMLPGSGSRRKFYNRERDLLISLHEPHPSPDVCKGAIRDVADHLKSNGVI